jgi:geranylgeranyl pyrophosphate synthase
LGAIAAGASAGVTAHAFEFGARVGEAYQLADDLQEVLKLDGQADNLLARISMLAPIFLYFSHETKSHVLRLLEKREEDCHQWIEKALPVLQTRMEHEVAVRLDLAIKEIKDFPDNPHTRMLHTAPSKVIRMILETNCPDDPSHPKEIPISGR